jgi:1-acyl-sn-glycerol-3-phosphate acyltransferase
MIVTIFVLAVIVVLSVPSAIVLIPFTLLTRNIGPIYRTGCAIVRVGFRAARIRIVVEGLERVPTGRACIFLSNHVSNLDPPALLPHMPGRVSVFAKRALFKIPIFGYCLKLGEFIPVDRGGHLEAARASIAAAERVLAMGVHILTFVEGTRSRDGRLLPFKKGPFYLAEATGALCVPISIHGSESLMAKGRMGIQPGTVHIVFHDPVDPKDHPNREELLHAVREAIASGLPEWMRR